MTIVFYIQFFNKKTKKIIDRGFTTKKAALEFKEAIEDDFNCEKILEYLEEVSNLPSSCLNLTKVNGKAIYL